MYNSFDSPVYPFMLWIIIFIRQYSFGIKQFKRLNQVYLTAINNVWFSFPVYFTYKWRTADKTSIRKWKRKLSKGYRHDNHIQLDLRRKLLFSHQYPMTYLCIYIFILATQICSLGKTYCVNSFASLQS